MFCRFCGNELADNEKVCPVCANSVDESTEKVKKKIDKKKIIIICIAVALVFCITIAVIAIVNEHNRKEEINAINQYLENLKDDDSVDATNKSTGNENSVLQEYLDKLQNANSNNSDKNSTGTLVEPLDFGGSGGIKPDKNSVKVQSLYHFAPDKMVYSSLNQKDLQYYQTFSGNAEDADIIKEYAELLNQNSMNFTLADSYYNDYSNVFASWGFNYTGNASVKNNCDIIYIYDEAPCAVSIYYQIDRNVLKGSIYWSASLEIEDMGYRYGGVTESAAPAGKSACAGLIRTASGEYQTTDGRFSVKPNEVQMYVNNTTKQCSLEYEDNNDSDMLVIKDSSGNAIIKFFFAKSTAPFTGEIYDCSDIALDFQYGSEPFGQRIEDLQVFQLVKNSWLRPTHSNNPFEDLTYRTVYYNETEKIAVFYLYTKVLDETEMFCVVDLNDVIDKTQNSSGGGSGNDVPNAGGYEKPEFAKLDCTFCNDGKCSDCNGYGKVYHSYGLDTDKPMKNCGSCYGSGNCRYCGGSGKRE